MADKPEGKGRRSNKIGNVLASRDKNGKQVIKNGKPSWRLRWEVRDPVTKQRKQEYEYFYGTRREAEAQWVEREAEIKKPGAAYVKPSKQPVAEYMSQWLARKTAGNPPDIQVTTADSYERMIRCHIVPGVGGVLLSDLTPAHVQGMVDRMRGTTPPSSPRTIAYARTVLRTAMEDAITLRLVPSNPVDRVKPPKQTPKQRDAFTLEQGEALFARADHTRIGPLIRFAFYAGLRRGEPLALRWSDVDLEVGAVTIRRSRVMVKGKAVEQERTKSESGMRVVPLPTPAVEALRMQRDRQRCEQNAAGPMWHDAGLVFTTADGKPLSPTNVSRDFVRLRDIMPCAGCGRPTPPDKRDRRAAAEETRYRCRHCGREWVGGPMPKLPLHALRHTAVSLMLNANVPLPIVSKVIGHKRYSLTVDQYGHMTPEGGQAVRAAVDEFLAKSKGPKPEVNQRPG